ncbi:MAG: hypothetical protein JOZ26_18690 [Hyphomicrobiales bacterium]|nr:hypothetical protein [Hyphomicrobiales bacterium]
MNRTALQIVDAGHRLAGAAMRHDAGEALAPAMEGDELSALYVVDDELGCWHGIVICSTTGGRAAAHDALEPGNPSAFRKILTLYGRRTLRPDERWRRRSFRADAPWKTRPHRNGNQPIVLVNTLFWKILVTRVNRKISV